MRLICLLVMSSFCAFGEGPRLFVSTYDSAEIARVVPIPVVEDRAGYRVQVIEVDAEDGPDAFEITLRYEKDGRVWSRTQIVTSDSHGFFNGYFWVGRHTRLLSQCLKSVRWSSTPEEPKQ